MIKNLIERESLAGIQNQDILDQVNSFLADFDVLRENVVIGFDLLVGLLYVGSLVWWFPEE